MVYARLMARFMGTSAKRCGISSVLLSEFMSAVSRASEMSSQDNESMSSMMPAVGISSVVLSLENPDCASTLVCTAPAMRNSRCCQFMQCIAVSVHQIMFT